MLNLEEFSDGLVGHWSLSKSDTTTGTTNLLTGTNSDMSGANNWSNNGFAVFDINTTVPGKMYFLFDGADQAYILNIGKPSQQYTVSLKARLNSGAGGITLGIGGAAAPGTANTVFGFTPTGTEQTFTGTFFTAGDGHIRIGRTNDATAVGMAFEIDDIIVKDTAGNVMDLTPSSNTGTRIGTTWSTGIHGQSNKALDFNGTSDYVLMGASPITGNADFSISAWIYNDNSQDSYGGFVVGTGSVRQSAYIGARIGQIVTGLYAVNIVTGISSLNTWRHVVLTHNSATGNMYAYVDGVYAGTSATGSTNITGDIKLGRFTTGIPYYFAGKIQDAKLYDKVLTQTEITSLYDSYKPQISFNSLNKGLAGYWSLAKGDTGPTDTTVKDKTTSNNSGTRVGTTWTTDRHGQANKALLFNGSSDYVDLSSSDFISDFGSDTKGSISVLVKPSVTTQYLKILSISKGDNSNNSIVLDSINSKFAFRDGFANIDIRSNDNFSINNWYHIVITQDGTTSKMYVNGIVQTDTDSGEWLASLSDLAYLRVGNIYYNSVNSSFFNGSLSDVRYYSGRALSQTEVTSLYDSYKPQIYFNSLNKGLGGYWSLAKSDTTTGTTNKVTNGTFDSDTGWTKGTGWTISGGKANCDGSQTGASFLYQGNSVTIGETYIVTYTISGYSAGNISASFSGSGTVRTADGTYTEKLTASSANLYLTANADFIGSVDDVTVYDVTGNVVDKTPNNNSGTRIGTTWTTDRHGQSNKALSFNGTSDYVDLSSSDFISNFGSDTKGSISVWFKTSQAGPDVIFGASNDTSDTKYLSLFIISNKITFHVYNTTLVVNIISNNDLNDNLWHNAIITQDGITSKMYIDGVLQTTTDSGEWFNTFVGLNNLRIGDIEVFNPVDRFWNGSISDVRYYSGRALTQTEVTQLYDSGS